MNKILLIGNSGIKHHGTDGQTTKVRLYLKKIKDEGFEVLFVDLEGFIKKSFLVLLQIYQGIKQCNRIVLISASRGCRILIPYINWLNRKYRKPFILPLIGTSVLHRSMDKLNDDGKASFLFDGQHSIAKEDKVMAKELAKLTYVLPETDLLVKVFKNFYRLDNVYRLENFRDINVDALNGHNSTGNSFRLVFLSRVMFEKGIIDLLQVVNDLLAQGFNITLDVYGKILLQNENDKLFHSLVDNINIKYVGEIENALVIQTLSKYDLFVFPTRFVGEGTPGVFAESLIAGTPILTTEFPQVHYLLQDGYDSFFCKMFDKDDLKNKLVEVINNRDLLEKLHKGASESGEKFTYEHERVAFLKYVCGVMEE